MSFVHLHTHSHYSLLDGLSKIDALVRAVKKLNMPALALTDHGVLYGTVEFYRKAKEMGVKPVIGMEAYVAPRGLKEREPGKDDNATHLILLARNLLGYRNLMKLSTVAHLEGFYYKPRIDKELLRAHAEGLIALSGCLNGEIPRLILEGKLEEAARLARWYQELFGSDHFYFELQHHPELEDQGRVNRTLRELSQKLAIPLVATQDSHYLALDDREAQDIMVCIQSGKKVEDSDRLDMRASDLSLHDSSYMRKVFADIPESCENTLRIASLVDCELPLGAWIFPHFPLPTGKTADEVLREQSLRGIGERMAPVSEEARLRLEYELSVIATRGYATYFLVVADFASWAKAQGIIATTRGSAAGSLAAYALGITTINPLEYKLPFERFLNLSRPLPPDIDMDFADNRRDEVIAYVTEKYGKDNVAQIITFGTMQARAAVRDVARVLGLPYGVGDRIAKMIPPSSQGFPMRINEALALNPELKMAAAREKETQRILAHAERLEGTVRHASTHAAGVVISPTPLTNYSPLQYEAAGRRLITQYDMDSLEAVGLLKMDLLGIRNLSILGRAVEIVERTKGVKVDLAHLSLDDKKTFELLAQGETIGLFQLGGAGMTRHLKELKPSSIYDIMAMVALFRPGPMNSIPEFIRRKHNPNLIRFLDPRMKDILSASYGVITYQDDVLLIAIELAGYTWEEADKLRKAMGKKIPSEMAKQKKKFVSGCITKGLSDEKALELWKLIEPFAAYGFNKAHAASYAMVAYQTAYMKAHYPAEFMASVLSAEAGDLDTVAEAITECRKMGIGVLPPDVRESFESFTVVDDRHIRFGLLAIKNVGTDIVDEIIGERKARGRFASLTDFVARVASKNLNKKSLESLAKCGALDSLAERATILENMEAILAVHRDHRARSTSRQGNLFGGESTTHLQLTLAPARPAPKKQRLLWEKELLGLYVTEHPFQELEERIRHLVTPCQDVAKRMSEEGTVRVAGIITKLQKIFTRAGDPMLFVRLEDTTGSLEVLVFPALLRTTPTLWHENNAVIIAGRVSTKEGSVKVLGEGAREIAVSA